MIYLITGLMASGKSTVAELLAKRLEKAVHLHGDVFRKMIVSGREEMCETPSEQALSQLRLRYRLSAEAAKVYHEAGFSVILQDNYYGQELPEMVLLLQPAPVCIIVLAPDANTIQKREQKRGKVGYAGFTVNALYQSFLEETPRIGLWIDSSNQTPEETVDQILKEATPYKFL